MARMKAALISVFEMAEAPGKERRASAAGHVADACRAKRRVLVAARMSEAGIVAQLLKCQASPWAISLAGAISGWAMPRLA